MTTLSSLTSSSGYESKVQVSCLEYGPVMKDESLCNSQLLFITCRVGVIYQPLTPSSLKSMPKLFRLHKSSSSFRVEYDQFVAGDGKGVGYAMLSDLHAPFALENIEWRSSLHKPWTPLEGKNDLDEQINDFVLNMVKKEETNQNYDSSNNCKEFAMSVTFENRILLPTDEYESMIQARKYEEERMKAIKAVAMNVLTWSLSMPGQGISRNKVKRMLLDKFKEIGIVATLDQMRTEEVEQHIKELKNLSEPRTNFATLIEKLDDVRLTGGNINSLGSCSICLQDIPLGHPVTCLPCSHGFHRACIQMWLASNRSCPLCRRYT